jgi:hypothetical protein
MKKSLIFLSLFLVMGPFAVYAGKPCTVCREEVLDESLFSLSTEIPQALECSQGHRIDRGCLIHQIQSLELPSLEGANQVMSEGLACCGGGGATPGCSEKFSLAVVMALLKSEEQSALKRRLERAMSTAGEPGDELSRGVEISQLSRHIQGAFNRCCPAEGCGATLDQIEGCNAATCSDESCKGVFCYLCLQPQENAHAAHAHVRDLHSQDYWERRPGYLDRYHWLLARKNLTCVFRGKVDAQIREAALDRQKALLQERKMWPFPAGIKLVEWLRGVQSADLSQQAKIELLQNEAIYRRQNQHLKNIALIEDEIRAQGGAVLLSLDVRDAFGNVSAPRDWISPVRAGDPRVTQEFGALGPMVQAAGLIWSGMAPEKLRHDDAIRFCQAVGARLPTVHEYRDLSGAMGGVHPSHYNPRLIPDMADEWFWSSSISPYVPSLAAVFFGGAGRISYFNSANLFAARCVIKAL